MRQLGCLWLPCGSRSVTEHRDSVSLWLLELDFLLLLGPCSSGNHLGDVVDFDSSGESILLDLGEFSLSKGVEVYKVLETVSSALFLQDYESVKVVA